MGLMYNLKVNSKQKLILWIAILASFVAFLDGSIVNVALPSITKELGGGLALQQWVIDAYLITLGALMLIAGSLSDIFGRKRILFWGLLGFGISSLLCMVAAEGVFLVLARALQGVAGALLVPSSLALIVSQFPLKKEGKAIGLWTAWTGMAFVAGPLLGGFLVDTFSWRAIFAINIFPIAITLYLLSKVKEPVDKNKRKVDFTGAMLCTFGLAGPVFALIEQARYGWHHPLIFLSFGIGLLFFVLFIWHEKYTKHPMLPLSLFAIRNFTFGNSATFFIYAALSVGTFLITIFIQQIGKFSALEAGLALLPITLIMFVLSPRFGELSEKYGPRLFMSLGPFIAAIGFLLMLTVELPINYTSMLLPAIIVFGLGLSMTVAPLTSAILSSIPSQKAGIGSAVNNAVSRIAGLIAIACLGLITGATLTLNGFQKGIITISILLFIGGIISFVGIKNPDKKIEN